VPATDERREASRELGPAATGGRSQTVELRVAQEIVLP
jgi:hypothetical protein